NNVYGAGMESIVGTQVTLPAGTVLGLAGLFSPDDPLMPGRVRLGLVERNLQDSPATVLAQTDLIDVPQAVGADPSKPTWTHGPVIEPAHVQGGIYWVIAVATTQVTIYAGASDQSIFYEEIGAGSQPFVTDNFFGDTQPGLELSLGIVVAPD